jgi:hypothetical protein
MNPLRTIILILAALMQALPAQALWPLAMSTGAVCEMGCCAALADQGLDACECSAGDDRPASEVPALPPAMRESEQVAAAIAAAGTVMVRRPEKRVDEARRARLDGGRAHLPEVRLAVLFCSFLN